MKKYVLETAVFLCGAAVMILELAGSRILAPYVGASLVVWTSLIGIILGFLSLGYWWGGKIADRQPNYDIFSFIIFLAAIFVGLITFSQSTILNFIQKSIVDIYWGAILATLSLFAAPSLLLGMVSPYAVRLKIKDITKSGETAGNLYAISTIGSIGGTFLAGFFLIPFLGSIKILLFLSIILIITSLLVYSKSFFNVRIAGILLFIIFFIPPFAQNLFSDNRNKIVDIDSQYHRIWLIKDYDRKSARPILNLMTGPGVQSAMFLDKDDELVLEYTKYYRLAGHFQPNLKHSLLIGGAAYSYPKDYLKQYPQASLEVVEIDSQLTEIAQRYFHLPADSRLTIHHEDGRTFLNQAKGKYDAVFIDAFNSHFSIPYQLTTEEAVRRIYDILENEGAALINIISSLEGEKSLFLRAEYKTYQAFFPRVYLFPVQNSSDSGVVQNIILVALKSNIQPLFKSSNQELDSYLKHLWTKEIKTDVPILTDDYAPVDYYIMKII